MPCHGRGNAAVQAFLGHIHQALGFNVYLSAGEGAGIVAVEAIDGGPGVDADNIARPDLAAVAGNSVNHLIVDADAGGSGEAVQPLEVGARPMPFDIVVDDFVQIGGGHAGLNGAAAQFQRFRTDLAGTTHLGQFLSIL